MQHTSMIRRSSPAILAAILSAAPALADDEGTEEASTASDDVVLTTEAAETLEQERPQGPPPEATRQGPPPGAVGSQSVFDETWVTIGVGAGLVPSYSGSDNYRVFPLPLIVGRVGGIGITPNGPGFSLDVLSQGPGDGPPTPDKVGISFGPAFRLRNDRDGQIQDEVVKLAGDLDTAIELGVQGGVRFPGVLNDFDAVTLSTQVRWDILGAHNGMLIEPGVSYFTPLGRGSAIQLAANLSFVDDSFADYYYTVTPAQSAATGLPEFTAEGGLNSAGLVSIVTVDLDGNLLNGGFNIYGIGGYSRLVGDAADTPFTATRGSADQFIGGIGVGYTF